jgi:hypothetical protein
MATAISGFVAPKLNEDQAQALVDLTKKVLDMPRGCVVYLDRTARHDLKSANERLDASLRQAKQFNANQRARIQRLQAAA